MNSIQNISDDELIININKHLQNIRAVYEKTRGWERIVTLIHEQEQIKQLLEQIDTFQTDNEQKENQKEEIEAKLEELKLQNRMLEEKLSGLKTQVAKTQEELKNYCAEIEEKINQIDDNKKKIESEKKVKEEQLTQYYMKYENIQQKHKKEIEYLDKEADDLMHQIANMQINDNDLNEIRTELNHVRNSLSKFKTKHSKVNVSL